MQAKEQSKFMRLEFDLMPDSLKQQLVNPDAYFLSYMIKMLFVAGTFILAHYFQQIDLSTMIIEKYIIEIQQQQLI